MKESPVDPAALLCDFFACGEDYTMADYSTVLPEKILSGREPFMIVGTIAGG